MWKDGATIYTRLHAHGRTSLVEYGGAGRATTGISTESLFTRRIGGHESPGRLAELQYVQAARRRRVSNDWRVLVPGSLWLMTKAKLQREFVQYLIETLMPIVCVLPFTVSRWPQFDSLSTANLCLPVYNNVNRCLPGDHLCELDKQRRKEKFFKSQAGSLLCLTC
ncbi:hypothetical protein PsorP6_013805 [Peronosclerospora sorghi]|uniref:Uncharacterized protein n=1 Tax=Peronosclerospora sorghi TaxID=230839 RepID=A0ACC0VGB4_9STRA|nr:hypothetical protein PsorP6_013805 [Peronosclerospora sorghi]